MYSHSSQASERAAGRARGRARLGAAGPAAGSDRAAHELLPARSRRTGLVQHRLGAQRPGHLDQRARGEGGRDDRAGRRAAWLRTSCISEYQSRPGRLGSTIDQIEAALADRRQPLLAVARHPDPPAPPARACLRAAGARASRRRRRGLRVQGPRADDETWMFARIQTRCV